VLISLPWSQVCYSAKVPVKNAKLAFQEAVAKVRGCNTYATVAAAWRHATFVKKEAEVDIWEGVSHAHDMTELEITQTTIKHLLYFAAAGTHLQAVHHVTKVNVTTNIGVKAACPFNNTCCHEDCVPGDPTCPAKGWGCCPTPGATCCKDKVHCCPDFLPVCDVGGQMCKPKGGGMLGALPFTHPLLTKNLNRTKVQPTRAPAAAREALRADAGNQTYARCEGHAEAPKCVPCAKGSTHGCVPTAQCKQQCQVQYRCVAKHADGGGWNWMCVEIPFSTSHPGGSPKGDCEDE
jgi:hypothetical protein